MQISVWTSELSCFGDCLFCIQVTIDRFSSVMFWNTVKGFFCSNGELGEPSSGQAKEINIALAASWTSLQTRGEKYVLHISKVATSSPVRDDLYPAYIGPLIQKNSIVLDKLSVYPWVK